MVGTGAGVGTTYPTQGGGCRPRPARSGGGGLHAADSELQPGTRKRGRESRRD